MDTITTAGAIDRQMSGSDAIRPFHVPFPDANLAELRRRISATQWPDRETVTDQSQGPQLATLQKLARYWVTEYDWRNVEARLNAVPNFITEIDGLDIHFIHVRSKHRNALPLIVTQGGDWGAIVTDVMGAQGHPELLGIHSNMPGIFSPDIDRAALTGAPPPSGLTAEETSTYRQLALEYAKGIGYGYQMGLRPQALYGIADSPVGIAGYFLDHDAASLALISRAFDGQPEGLTRDDVLDNITLTWLTNTFTSGARLYWEAFENKVSFFGIKGVRLPVAVSVFPDELYQAPKSWAERAYPNLVYYNKVEKGGHFAAWEQPKLFSEEVRAGFRSLRG